MPGELERHLAEEESPNRKNDTLKKTIKPTSGLFELSAPRGWSEKHPVVIKSWTNERETLSAYLNIRATSAL